MKTTPSHPVSLLLHDSNPTPGIDARPRGLGGTGFSFAMDAGKSPTRFREIRHIAFDTPPLTRKERADGGLASVESPEILKVDPLRSFGRPTEIIGLYGGKPAYLAAVPELETATDQRAA